MFGPSFIHASNNAGTVQRLMDLAPYLLYDADEIATAAAYEAGWTQGIDGIWLDADEVEREHPLDELFHCTIDPDLGDEITDEVIKVFNAAYKPEIEADPEKFE